MSAHSLSAVISYRLSFKEFNGNYFTIEIHDNYLSKFILNLSVILMITYEGGSMCLLTSKSFHSNFDLMVSLSNVLIMWLLK